MKTLTLHHLGRRLAYDPYCQIDFKYTKYSPIKQVKIMGVSNGEDNKTDSQIEFILNDELEFRKMDEFRLILRPLSDLTKPISQDNYNDGHGFTPYKKLCDQCTTREAIDAINYYKDHGKVHILPYWAITLLLQWHFVLDEPTGTWIDVNSLNENPY